MTAESRLRRRSSPRSCNSPFVSYEARRLRSASNRTGLGDSMSRCGMISRCTCSGITTKASNEKSARSITVEMLSSTMRAIASSARIGRRSSVEKVISLVWNGRLYRRSRFRCSSRFIDGKCEQGPGRVQACPPRVPWSACRQRYIFYLPRFAVVHGSDHEAWRAGSTVGKPTVAPQTSGSVSQTLNCFPCSPSSTRISISPASRSTGGICTPSRRTPAGRGCRRR